MAAMLTLIEADSGYPMLLTVGSALQQIRRPWSGRETRGWRMPCTQVGALAAWIELGYLVSVHIQCLVLAWCTLVQHVGLRVRTALHCWHPVPGTESAYGIAYSALGTGGDGRCRCRLCEPGSPGKRARREQRQAQGVAASKVRLGVP
eukprot:212475-Rhodomonas_salina.1